MLRREYVCGEMRQRTQATYSARVMGMLSRKRPLRFAGEHVVLAAPREETLRCQAQVAKSTRAFVAYMRLQCLAFGIQGKRRPSTSRTAELLG